MTRLYIRAPSLFSMGKCCSKPQEDYKTKKEPQLGLLELDPGGGGGDDDEDFNMTGGAMITSRTPGRWGGSPRGTSPTKKATIVAGSGVRASNTITITKGPAGTTNAGARVTKTFQFSSSGAATETVTYNGQMGHGNMRFVTTKHGYVSGAVTRTSTTTNVPVTMTTTRVVPITITSRVPTARVPTVTTTARVPTAAPAARVPTITTTARVPATAPAARVPTITARVPVTTTSTAGVPTTTLTNERKKRSFFGISSPFGQRMGKTKTETTTRTFTKDGTRYEETVEVVTKEDEAGNVTKTTKTTTRALDPYSTSQLAAAIDDSPKPRRARTKSSSSSSSSSSPDRAKSSKTSAKQKVESGGAKSSKSGFRIKLKSGKADDGDSSDDDDFAKGVHKSVNEYRTKHGVSKLKLNKEMNKYAKEWAKKMATEDKLALRPDNKYGENVFCLSSNTKEFKVKPEQVVDKWYGESKEHKFGEEPQGTRLKSGHFTQMVWKDTTQMGVGKARTAAGTKVFVVANFDPQGNWMGQFADQVPPVGGFPKTASAGKSSLFSSKTRKASSSDSDSDEDDFAKECLKSHNDYRAKHGAPPLKLSKKLSKYAEEWAKTIAKKETLQHRPNNSYGENLYCAWSSNPKHKIKGSEAVDSWYSEIKDFTFGREPSDLRAGHFTQVVWMDSTELGVAIARSKSGKIFVVANYSPAGNFVGSFATKVPRLK
nr:nucleoporin NSP1-like isoform X2 [Procambarus clarkii]